MPDNGHFCIQNFKMVLKKYPFSRSHYDDYSESVVKSILGERMKD